MWQYGEAGMCFKYMLSIALKGESKPTVDQDQGSGSVEGWEKSVALPVVKITWANKNHYMCMWKGKKAKLRLYSQPLAF